MSFTTQKKLNGVSPDGLTLTANLVQIVDDSGNPVSSGGGGEGGSGNLATAGKGVTTSGNPTSTNASSDRQLLDVILRDSSGNPITSFGASNLTTAAKGSTLAGNPTSSNLSVDRQALDVILRDSVGGVLSNFPSNLQTAAKGLTGSGSPTSTNAGVDRQLLDVILRESSGTEKTSIHSILRSSARGANPEADPTTVILTSDVAALSVVSVDELGTNVNIRGSLITSLGTHVSRVIKSGIALTLAVTVSNSNAATRWFQIFDRSSVPTGGETPIMSWPVYGNGGLLVLDRAIFDNMFILTTGTCWGMSTTMLTYTPATANETIVYYRYL